MRALNQWLGFWAMNPKDIPSKIDTDGVASIEKALAEMGAVLEIKRDPDLLAKYESDIFEVADHVPLALAFPRSVEDIEHIARIAKAASLTLRPLGAGLSYTGGYLAQGPREILVDLSGMDRVISVSAEDLCASVEPGCTWQTLLDELKALKLRPTLRPPMSGSHSTIGGAVSQGLPGPSDGVVSIDLVTPSGTMIKTGARGYTEGLSDFAQSPGADLTGLLVGDCGQHGIKTRMTLRLEPVPQHRGYCGFVFSDLHAAMDALAAIVTSTHAQFCIGFDPSKMKQARKPDVNEVLNTGWTVLRNAGPLAALQIAMGFLRPAPLGWTIYASCEGNTKGEVEYKLSRIRKLAKSAEAEISPAIARALDQRPFSIRGIAGPAGEAWVPVHGIFPPSKAANVAEKLDDAIEKMKPELESHSVELGVMMLSLGPHILIEPMLMWPGKLAPIALDMLDTKKIRGFVDRQDDSALREFVANTRAELRDLFARNGATFLQRGSYYPAVPRDTSLDGLLDR